MVDIFQMVKEYETDFLTKPVSIVDGYDFDQADTIKRTHLYMHSRFEGDAEDDIGEKVFFNILIPRARNAAKNIDLDTKDIRIQNKNGSDWFDAWIARRVAWNWMKENRVGHTLNKIPEALASYGTVVVKKTGGKEIFKLVDLRNLKCDPTAESLEHSWIIEDHYYTPTELRMKKGGEWDDDLIDKAIKSFKVSRKENYVDLDKENAEYGDAQYILVKEFYADVPRGLIDDTDDEEHVRGHFVVVMPDDADSDKNEEEQEQGLILSRREVKKDKQGKVRNPYKEVHFRKISGRWLGEGVFEAGTELQVFKNEQMNALRMSFQLAKLLLFQTNDKTVLKNVFDGLRNGDIMKFARDAQGLSRVDTRSYGTGESNVISQEIDKLANAITNSFEVTTGETLPSGTPFSLGALMNQNANKLFELIRESYGLFLQEIFEEWVLPEIEKDVRLNRRILEVTDTEELKMVRDRIVKKTVLKKIKQFILLKGRKPTVGEVEMVENVLKTHLDSREAEYLVIPKDLFDFDKKVHVVVTGERQSPAEMQTLQTILQLTSQNPQITENPAFQKILDHAGYSPLDFQAQTAPQEVPQLGQ